MRKHKLLNTEYDEERHIYSVTIGTDVGPFTGSVTCKPEDYCHEKTVYGYELAEMKATLKYAAEKRKIYHERFEGLLRYWNIMKNTRNYDIDAYWVKILRRQLNEYKHERNQYRMLEERIEKAYQIKVQATDDYWRRTKA